MNPELAGNVNLDALLDQGLFWARAKDAIELWGECLNDTGVLVEKVALVVLVFKKWYVDIV